MNRRDFQAVARTRVREARILLESQEFAGAYYLLGYCVECALKACVAKQTRRHDFPSKQLANDVHTHDLEKLFRLSGVWTDFQNEKAAKEASENNWTKLPTWYIMCMWMSSL